MDVFSLSVLNTQSSAVVGAQSLLAGSLGMWIVSLHLLLYSFSIFFRVQRSTPRVPLTPAVSAGLLLDSVFRTDSEKTSTVLDLLHDRTRGLFPQLESAVNETEEEGKGGLVEKLTFSPLEAETPGAVSKVSAPSTNRKAQTTIKVSPLA